MTYYEEKLLSAEKQVELAVAGFETIAKRLVEEGGGNLAELFEQYITAIDELKRYVKCYKAEVEKEKEKAE